MGAIAVRQVERCREIVHTFTNSKRGSPNPARKELGTEAPPALRASRSRGAAPPAAPFPFSVTVTGHARSQGSTVFAFRGLLRPRSHPAVGRQRHGLLGGHAVGRPHHPRAPR